MKKVLSTLTILFCVLIQSLLLVISCTDKQESTSFDDQSVFLAEYDVDSIHITYSKGTSFTKSSDRDYITVTASDDNNYCQIVVDRVECKDGVVYSNHYDCNGNLLATLTFIDDELVDIDIFIDEEIDYSFEPETKGRRNGGSFVSCFAKVYNENREFLNSEESGLAGILCDAPGISTICHAANAIVSTLLCVF